MNTFKLPLSLLLITLLSLSGCAGTDITTTRVDVAGMNNSVVVTGDILIGGQPTEAALTELANDGYTTVITARADDEISWDEKAFIESLGMRYVSIPMPGPDYPITDQHIELFDEVIRTNDGPVVFHCGSGNRAAGFWAVWLVEKKGLDPDEALELAEKAGMKSVRPVVERRLGVESEM
jgi:uncharacterized protein (TIGR01244 family)